MKQSYDASFAYLCEQIGLFSPSTIPLLEQITHEAGSQSGYYAAFVLLCLHIQRVVPAQLPPHDLTRHDLKDLTFFELAKDNPSALDLFDQVLQCYQQEQRR